MSKDEKEKFIKLTSQMNIKSKEKTDEFLMKIAKGELKLEPNKKPSVIEKIITQDVSLVAEATIENNAPVVENFMHFETGCINLENKIEDSFKNSLKMNY